jgi:hypothetical protein
MTGTFRTQVIAAKMTPHLSQCLWDVPYGDLRIDQRMAFVRRRW